MIKKGTTRIVIILNDLVIKIPNFTYSFQNFINGIAGNYREWQTYKWNSGKFERGFSHLLCPVVWNSWLGLIVVMKRAKELTSYQWEEFHIDDHIKHFRGDDKKDNYGIYDNRIVKIDYGS